MISSKDMNPDIIQCPKCGLLIRPQAVFFPPDENGEIEFDGLICPECEEYLPYMGHEAKAS